MGALLNRDFRFRARAWFLSSAPSVCTGCSRNCSIFVDYYGQDAYRYRPRENEAINKSWMCDAGRLSYKYLNKDRALSPMLGRGADARDATRAEAAKAAATKLSALAGTAGLAVAVSPLCSNEDLLGALSFAKDVLKVTQVFASGRPMDRADHYLLTADRNPNRKGLEWVAAGLGLAVKPFDELVRGMEAGTVKALWAVGGEVPVDAEAFAQAAAKLELFVLQAINDSRLTAAADVLLPASPHVEDEGTFANLDGIVQRFRQAYPAARGEPAALAVGERPAGRAGHHHHVRLGARGVAGAGAEGAGAGVVRVGHPGAAGARGARGEALAHRGGRAAAGVPRVRRPAGEGDLGPCAGSR